MSQSVTPAARTDSAVTDPRETTESSPIQTEDRQDEIAGPSTAASEPPPHQGATQSGDTAPQVYVLQPPPTFKEQVIGYAKEIRGSILRQPETKEYGEKILRGEASYPPKD